MLVPTEPPAESQSQECPPNTPAMENTVSSAMDRYLSETSFQEGTLYGRLMTGNAHTDKNRDSSYEERQRTQLISLATKLSQPERNDPQQFPFRCVFHFAGCEQRFPNKAEWKQHVWAEHIGSHYWLCTQGSCGRGSKQLEPVGHARLSPSITSPSQGRGGHLGQPTAGQEVGTVFRRKDFLTQHMLSTHHRTSRNPGDEWHHHVVDSQDSAMRSSPGLLPQHLRCPVRGCSTVHFHGPTAWNQRLDHAAGHFLKEPQRTGVFGGPTDADLVEWAVGPEAAVIERAQHQGGWILRGIAKDDVPLTDSGYGGSNGEPTHSSSHSEPGSSVVPESRRQRRQEMAEYPMPVGSPLMSAVLPVYDRSTDFSKERSTPLTIFSSGDSEDAGSLLPDSAATSVVGSSLEDAPQQRRQANLDVESVMAWFSAWLQERLGSHPQQQDAGEGGSNQNDSSQGDEGQATGQQSNVPLQPGNRRVGDGRSSKRKRDGNEDEDGDERGKRTRDNNFTQEVSGKRFVCPFYKFNPRKYGKPRWKACVYPGYKSIHRLKEHINRRHSLPKYQCERCLDDLKGPIALEDHRRQEIMCTVRTDVIQDGITWGQRELMRYGNRATQNKTEEGNWEDIYRILFPDEAVVPSPYRSDVSETILPEQLAPMHQYRQFLMREIPRLVRRRLATGDFGQLDDAVCEKLVEMFPALVIELDKPFSNEIGHTVSEAGTEAKAESLYSGGGLSESTEIGATEEGLMADAGVPFSMSNLAGIDTMDDNDTCAALFDTSWDRDEAQRLQDACEWAIEKGEYM